MYNYHVILAGRVARLALVAMLPVMAVACGGRGIAEPSSATTSSAGGALPGGTQPVPGSLNAPQVFVGAGDIAMCGAGSAEATAALLDGIAGTVFTLGDNAYFHGTAEDYRNCYDPTWGRHKRRTRPTPGNHEYESAGAIPYFDYFGASAGPYGLGYYSFDLGNWHIVSLNSNVPAGPASAQAAWLQDDLDQHNARCTLAYFHHPLFTSGPDGPTFEMRALWQQLYRAGAEVILNGHEHFYERFAPQTPDGAFDLVTGIRQFIVGTGGATIYGRVRSQANSEVLVSANGVLKLTLGSGGYTWDFVPVSGAGDTGSGTCH